MKLTKDQISTLEPVGKTQKGEEVLHCVTKGGLNMMIKSANGEFKILSQAPHRGIARYHANQIEKNISWHESLYKSEKDNFKPSADVVEVVESTPDKHIQMATYHSYKANGDDGLDGIAHLDSALAHFKASGLDHGGAVKMVQSVQSKLHKSYRMDEPYDSDMLRLAYEKKYNKPFPEGLEG